MKYKKSLQEYLNDYQDKLTDTSKRRLTVNPLRILDTKVDFEINILKKAPTILDFLNNEDSDHFKEVKNYLDNLNIPYTIDNKLVAPVKSFFQN